MPDTVVSGVDTAVSGLDGLAVDWAGADSGEEKAGDGEDGGEGELHVDGLSFVGLVKLLKIE